MKEKAEINQALIVALMRNDPKKITEALSLGADVDQAGHVTNPLHLASWNCFDTMERLIMMGANVNLPSAQGITPLMGEADVAKAELLLRHRADVDARDSWGKTAAHHAAFAGKQELINLLFQHKADFTIRTDEGTTADEEAEDPTIQQYIKDRRLEQEAAKMSAPK